MSTPQVRFFLPEPAGEIARLSRIDADRDWRRLVTGDRAWVLQTFLRLRDVGAPVELVHEIPRAAAGLLLFHAKHERLVRRALGSGRQVLVGIRADNRRPLSAEFEILQNGLFADGERRFFLPHWPQPGLIPRDPARGSRIESIAYKGFDANLAPGFLAPDWAAWLAERGIDWRLDAIEFAGAATDVDSARWADFRDVDLCLAVRPPRRGGARAKPATKLVNGWLAGVPTLLGPEPAFRELRRDPLDYLEVADVEEARRAVERLVADPKEYRARVEHGHRRAAEFDRAALTARWRELLFETLPRLAQRRSHRLFRRLPLEVRRLLRLAGRWTRLEPAR